MSCHKLLQSHLLRHFHYLNQSRTFLVAVCPDVSCCWPKFQSIFNPCNPLQQTTGNNKIHQDIKQQEKYEIDSDNESDEEGNFEVVYGEVGMISTITHIYFNLCNVSFFTRRRTYF